MTKRKQTRLLAAALALCLLSACAGGTQTPEESYVPGELAGSELGVSASADKVFSLNSSLSDSFQPYMTRSADNWLVGQLAYENIFELDEDYVLSSRIVTDYTNVDGTYWVFTVDTGVQMHDGTSLTAQDVAYSVQLARNSTRYGARLSNVWGASANSETTFAISLAKADLQLPLLLNIPVVKYGSANESRPAGSGPYAFAADGDYLAAFSGYPDSASLPVDIVYLKEYSAIEEIITAFEDSYIDLVLNDPSGKSNLGYGGNTETRYFTTTNLHYFGFHMEGDLVKYPTVRAALAMAIDRDYAARTLMQGGAVAAALPVSPKSPLYDEGLAAAAAYDMEAVRQTLYNANVRDHDEDGKLELLETGIPLEIELDLIVCAEAAGKGDIAKKFAADMAELGFAVNVRELSWADYQTALEEGDFDMYYAEVKLPANFDLTSLLAVEGSMNYGGVEDERYQELINAYLAAGDDARGEAVGELLRYILQNAPIIPVCFERQEVITHRNVISGLDPDPANIFAGITGWTINFEEEEQ